MTVSRVLSWREGVVAEADSDGSVRIEGRGARLILRGLDPALATALGRLAPPGDDEDRLGDLVQRSSALAGWYYHLQGLARRGLVTRGIEADGERLATLVPTGPGYSWNALAVPADRSYVLSRFAHLRRESEGLVLESPRAHARILLDDPRLAGLIGALATPGTLEDLARRAVGVPEAAIAPLVGLFDGAAMLEHPGAEEESEALRCWEFHDLLFHARSRRGRSDAPFGATYRMSRTMEPPPAVRPKPPGEGEVFDLARPDLARIERDDPPLARVMAERRSIREYGTTPITARQLGEFLFRVARVMAERQVDVESPAGPLRMTFAQRPYPSGGALYELEFYVAVRACEGLAPGLYSYDPRAHRLLRQPARQADMEQLLRDAAASAAIAPDRVQVLVILSARFPRLAWKYSSIAYSLILKHVGVVFQTMYLTATAMNLAPCALGGGDSDLFARAAGTEYEAESSVGEFLLGSRGPEAPSDDETG